MPGNRIGLITGEGGCSRRRLNTIDWGYLIIEMEDSIVNTHRCTTDYTIHADNING